ncbi:50S ribosomal protein L31e [Candidatus Micrarchaeota archaeon]|nr:50S ribosomal protein L31e [Candidatus Micrarchaeota archaeon]
MVEKICIIPFRKAYEAKRTKRMAKSAKLVREYVARHMKMGIEDVRISAGVNHALSEHGAAKPPRRLKVKIVKGDSGIATAWLMDEQEKNAAVIKKLEEKKKAMEEKKKKAQAAKPAASKQAEKPKAQEAKAQPVQQAKPAEGNMAQKPMQAAKPQ